MGVSFRGNIICPDDHHWSWSASNLDHFGTEAGTLSALTLKADMRFNLNAFFTL